MRHRPLHTLILLVVLLGLFPFAMERRYPAAAPRHVQEEGRMLARATLHRLEQTPFGQTRRGKALIEEANRLMEGHKVYFSDDLGGARGLTVNRFLGARRVYLKVIPMNNGVYLQQLDWQLAEALIHEAVHYLRGGFAAAGFEEECDAFAAGLQAEAALRNMEPTFPLQLDDLSIAEFVRSQYPGIRPAPDYQPVEITREDLAAMTGFNLPKKTRPLIHTNPH